MTLKEINAALDEYMETLTKRRESNLKRYALAKLSDIQYDIDELIKELE